MRSIFWNVAAIVTAVVVAGGYEFGLIAGRDAFFFMFSLGAIYMSAQLLTHEGEAVGPALAEIFTNPQSHKSTLSYVSTITVAAFSTLIVVQTLVS